MIFITGPLFSGKKQFVREKLGYSAEDFGTLPRDSTPVLYNAHLLAAEKDPQQLAELADLLAQKEVVITDEVGGGVVPVDASLRAARENAGLLGQMLARRADTVVRIWCGLPLVLKGRLPESKEGR